MEANKKIDLINAYRQVQGQILKVGKGTSEEIVTIVQQEFQAFVSSRIEELLNGKAMATAPEVPQIPANQLTDEDVTILLALVDNVKSKQRLNEAANAPVQAAPHRKERTPRPPNPNAKPLRGNPDPDPTGQGYRNANEGLLRQLARMDNEGPDF